jgi:hypothetical protein
MFTEVPRIALPRLNCATSTGFPLVFVTFAAKATFTPVIVAFGGTDKPKPLPYKGADAPAPAKPTVAYILGFVDKAPDGLDQAVAEVLVAMPGATEGLKFCPPLVEVYAVGLKTFKGLAQLVLVAVEPWLGPTNRPVADTALAFRPEMVNIGPFTTWAMKVFNVTDSL